MGNVALILITVAVMLLVGWWLDSRVRRYYSGNAAWLEKQVGDVRKTLDNTLVRVTKLEESSKKEPVSDGGKAPAVKQETPFTRESIRTGLRYNGCVAGDFDDNGTIGFTKNDARFCVFTSNCPFLVLGMAYRLNPEEEDLDLMRRAAADVMGRTLIGKITVPDDGTSVYFQAEYYCDSYVYFRDSFKYYLDLLIETHNRFFDTYAHLKEEKRKSLEALRSAPFSTLGEDVPGSKIVS